MLNKFKLILILCPFQTLFAQVDTYYLQHLSEKSLKVEYLAYLQKVEASEDSLSYYLSKYYFQYGNDSLFIRSALKSKEIIRQDTTLLVHYSKSFLNPLAHNNNDWFSTILDTTLLVNEELKQLNLVYNLSQKPLKEANLPLQLQHDYNLFYKSTKKKSIVAAVFSTIIPGSGMLYLNKPKAFASSFAIVGGLGYQTFESYRILGLNHPLTIINGAFFTGFYLVNIIGSYLEVKKHQKEQKKQFLIHASTYYTDTYPSSLF